MARFEAIDNFINLTMLMQTTCDIMVNSHVCAGGKEMSQLIAGEWNCDGLTTIRAQGILANFDNFGKIILVV